MARINRCLQVALVAALFVVATPLNVVASAAPAALAAIDTWSMATIPLPSTDVVHDATRDVLLVTVPSSHPSLGNSVVELDPVTGALGRHVWVGGEPGRVVITDDGTTAYVSLNVSTIVEVDLASFTVTDRIDLGRGEHGEPLTAQDLDTLPGRSDIVVVALAYLSGGTAGARAYVGGEPLPVGLSVIDAPDRIEATSSTTLFGYRFGQRLHMTLVVGATGITSSSSVGPIDGPSSLDMEAALGHIYTTRGLIVDPSNYEAVGSVSAMGLIEVTPTDGRVTVADDDDGLVSVFDAATGAPIEARTFVGMPDATALAASSTGFALSGPTGVTLLGPGVTAAGFVPPPPPAPMLRDLDQVVLPYHVNDLLYDAARGQLYATVASVSGSEADRLLALDPTTGAVVRTLFLGSNPTVMQRSGDGGRLFVGLRTTGRIATVDLATFTMSSSFTLGSTGSGPNFAEDIEIRPGTDDELLVAVASGSYHQFVALFVDGVQMPTTSWAPGRSNRIEVESDRVYGLNRESSGYDHVEQRVTDAGLPQAASYRKFWDGSTDDIELIDGLLHSGSRVVDPAGPSVVGRTGLTGVAGYDAAADRLIVGRYSSSTTSLHEIDRATLRQVARYDLGRLGRPVQVVSTRTESLQRVAVNISPPGIGPRQLVLLSQVPGRFHEVVPARLADTRIGAGAPLGRVPAGGSITVDVTGVGGVPAGGVEAVVVNLTSVGSTTASHLTAWATGEPKPSTSNVNFRAGQVAANQAIVPVGDDGTISIANSAGATHVVVDVQGWFGDGADAGGSRLNPVVPARLADSRSGLGVPAGRVVGGATVDLDVTGVGGVPEAGASAVVVNITAVGALAPTHLTLWASGGSKPATSNVNVAAGQVVANQAIVPVGADGRISIANAAGATHVIVDVQAWFGDEGTLFHPVSPARVADSRTGVGVPTGKVPAGGTVVVDVAGVAGVPPAGAVAVVVNLTVTGATASSHLTAWPSGQAKPGTSNVNFGAGQVVANQAIVPVGADGTITIANAAGATHVVVDVQGWFGPTG